MSASQMPRTSAPCAQGGPAAAAVPPVCRQPPPRMAASPDRPASAVCLPHPPPVAGLSVSLWAHTGCRDLIPLCASSRHTNGSQSWSVCLSSLSASPTTCCADPRQAVNAQPVQPIAGVVPGCTLHMRAAARLQICRVGCWCVYILGRPEADVVRSGRQPAGKSGWAHQVAQVLQRGTRRALQVRHQPAWSGHQNIHWSSACIWQPGHPCSSNTQGLMHSMPKAILSGPEQERRLRWHTRRAHATRSGALGIGELA